MAVLCVTACGSSRTVTRESHDRVATYETRDSSMAERVVVMDTVKEVTTVTVQTNEAGDTIRMATVTDRLRSRGRDAIAVQRTKTEIVRDTVYVERRDSVDVKETLRQAQGDRARASPVVLTLKWVFWIIIGLIGLVIVVKIRGRP